MTLISRLEQAEAVTREMPVTAEMLKAYVEWEPPAQFDAGDPIRALGLIRAAFFAGYIASLKAAGYE
jgi:hypothetical protein